MQDIASFLRRNKSSIIYFLLLVIITGIIFFIIPKKETKKIIDFLENKTFDIRQNIISKHRETNKDIVIISIDDPSYEYLIETYGDWPAPRHVYAELLDYLEAQNPKYVIFDLLFIKSLRSIKNSDEKLIDAFRKYKNVYTGINFDDYPFEVRKPPVLDDKIKTDIVSESDTLDPYEFTNCRSIMPELIAASPNIGHINTFVSEDGVIRQIPVFVKYPDYNPADNSVIKQRSYLYMTVKLAVDYLNRYQNAGISEIRVDKDNNLVLGSRKIPVLNWYGESGIRKGHAFKYISLQEVIRSYQALKEGRKPVLDGSLFKDKIIYIGACIHSLSDIKTVPSSRYMPGVEIHASLLNNIIDNCFIKKASVPVNSVISLILALAAAFIVFKIRSVYFTLASLAVMSAFYMYASAFIMLKYNLWLWIVIPVLSVFVTFIISFIIKYIITSRDFEYMYKLAATDGLTELYNHRFFQEQIRKNIKNAEKSKSSFSLILIDIDFFKKFNDKYGHQAGDAVLKHVAKTLKSSVRAGDYVCRYGGEEMTILLNNADREAAVKIAQNICTAIASRKYALSKDLEVNITISLGVSSYPENGTEAEVLIEYADKCLYKAKENGRNQVGFLD